MVTIVSRAWRASLATSACASAEPSTGSVPDATSSTSTSDRSVAAARIATRLLMCPENVERLISIDCRSPMSASTSSNTGSTAVSAGTRSPDWCSSAASPSVFSATVLPPVFGPRDHERAQPTQVEVDRHGAGGVEQRMPRFEQAHLAGDLHRRPAPAARERRAGDGEVDCAGGLDERFELDGARADRGGELAEDPRHLFALGDRRLRLAVVQLDHLERLDEERLPGRRDVVDDPGHAAPRARLHGEDGPPAALGDEVLLQMLLQARRAPELAQLVGDALPAVAQLLAQLAQLR